MEATRELKVAVDADGPSGAVKVKLHKRVEKKVAVNAIVSEVTVANLGGYGGYGGLSLKSVWVVDWLQSVSLSERLQSVALGGRMDIGFTKETIMQCETR